MIRQLLILRLPTPLLVHGQSLPFRRIMALLLHIPILPLLDKIAGQGVFVR